MYLPADQKVWEEIFRGRLIRRPKFWLPLLIIMLLTTLLPEQFLISNLLSEKLLNVMSLLVPSIPKWVERSYLPGKTGLLYSLSWLVLPHYLYLFANHRPYAQNFVNKWLNAGARRHFYPFILMILTIIYASIFYFSALPAEQNCMRFCIHWSLWLQMIYALLMILGLSALFATVFYWLTNFNKIHLGDKK